MIAQDNQPFSVVEDEEFRRLINYLEPRYAMPSRRYFSDVALAELYTAVYVHIEKLLSDVTHVSFTSDIWTSIYTDSQRNVAKSGMWSF